jgi:vancomycin resistance protein VanJ
MSVRLRQLVVFSAYAYPLLLLGLALLFRWVGERWWVTLVALYLPRIGFALPLPFLALGLSAFGLRREWWTQVAALALLMFPLMGLELHRRPANADQPRLRVLSYNVHLGWQGLDKIRDQVDSMKPDLVAFQEVGEQVVRYFRPHFAGWHVHVTSQFLFASRFPIRDVYLPPKLAGTPERSPRWVRYTIETSSGLIDFYNVHPLSPREGLEDLRGQGLRSELRSGHFFVGPGPRRVEVNTDVRVRQVADFAGHAARRTHPVLIAGDTNLPGLSWALGYYLGDFIDGFSAAGFGFGYTFPAHHPWMRIDRIFASPDFRFLTFSVGRLRGSDHLCVVADLQRRD